MAHIVVGTFGLGGTSVWPSQRLANTIPNEAVPTSDLEDPQSEAQSAPESAVVEVPTSSLEEPQHQA